MADRAGPGLRGGPGTRCPGVGGLRDPRRWPDPCRRCTALPAGCGAGWAAAAALSVMALMPPEPRLGDCLTASEGVRL